MIPRQGARRLSRNAATRQSRRSLAKTGRRSRGSARNEGTSSELGARMELMDRFFGRGTPQFGEPPVANPWLENAPTFTLLFPAVPDLDPDALTLALRDYHPELGAA